MKKNIVFYYVDEWTILNENMKFKSNCLVLSNDFKTDFLNDIDEIGKNTNIAKYHIECMTGLSQTGKQL